MHDPNTEKEVQESILRGIEQAANGEGHCLGSFEQYASPYMDPIGDIHYPDHNYA